MIQITFERLFVIAIAFDDTGKTVPKKLNYTILSSELFSKTYFQLGNSNAASDRLIREIPVVPLQMCIDDAFIDISSPEGITKPVVGIFYGFLTISNCLYRDHISLIYSLVGSHPEDASSSLRRRQSS